MAEEEFYLEGPTYRIEQWRPAHSKESGAVAIQLIATEISRSKAYPEVKLNFVFLDLQDGGALFDAIAHELYLRAAQKDSDDSQP